jgi:putative intracellular protease/amidase
MKVAMIITSHNKMGATGQNTGFWFDELATPYYAFKKAGVALTLASPKGGKPPIEPISEKPEAQNENTMRFLKDADAQMAMENTVSIDTLIHSDFDAVLYIGGHGPVWDISENESSTAFIEAMYAAGKPVAVLCHGPVALRFAKNKNGDLIVKGKKITAFTNTEEEALGLKEAMPFLIEDVLKENGAEFSKVGDFQPNVVVDGNLISGQNPASTELIVSALLKMIDNTSSVVSDNEVSTTDFTVVVENVSNRQTLHTSKGNKDAGLSPGSWCLHHGENPMYKVGDFATTMLERMAEDGNPEGFYSDLQFNPEVKATGSFNYTVTPYPIAGFIGGGQSFEFVVKGAVKGDRLSMVTMLIESNDWFYANDAQGIELFDAQGKPVSGNLTDHFGLFDAGTEENEEPGVGMNQAPRQTRPDTGTVTEEPVYAIIIPSKKSSTTLEESTGEGDNTFSAPKVESVIKVTITPNTSL